MALITYVEKDNVSAEGSEERSWTAENANEVKASVNDIEERLQTVEESGGGTVESVTGDGVDNTDPDNPVLSFPDADEISFTPAGNLAATDVQAAIVELDTEKTDEAYVDAAIAQEVTDRNAAIVSAVAGLMDYRGVFDASVNAYPSSGGSGAAGAIIKSDFWIISVAGTLPTGLVVAAGDLVIAKQDTPGNTQANWSIVEYNIGYTPVNKAGDTMGGNLAMGSNKITGLAAASGNGEAVRYEQITGVFAPLAGSKVIQLAASDEATALTTGTAKITFRMPYAMTLTAVRASLGTAQTSGSIFTVDINEGGTTILSTKLTIDNTEKTSTTAATAAVISDASLADDAEITVDIDQIGDGTAKGLKITLIGS